MTAGSAVCTELTATAGGIRTEGALYDEIVNGCAVFTAWVGGQERRGYWLLSRYEMRRRGSETKKGDDLKN